MRPTPMHAAVMRSLGGVVPSAPSAEPGMIVGKPENARARQRSLQEIASTERVRADRLLPSPP